MGPSAGSGYLGSFTASTSGVVSGVISTDQAQMATVESKGDGTQTVTVDIQASLVPGRGYNRGATTPVRDDSYASTDWVTLTTNTMTSGSAWSRIDQIPFSAFHVLRVRFTSAAGTSTCSAWVRVTGVE